MTTTFRFPKLACGIALAASLVSGATAHAQRGAVTRPAPRERLARSSPIPRAGKQLSAEHADV